MPESYTIMDLREAQQLGYDLGYDDGYAKGMEDAGVETNG